MPTEPYRFHLHTLEEIYIAHRIWGPAGVRAMLGTPTLHALQPLSMTATPQRAPRPRSARERSGLGWLRLRRAPHAAVR